MRQPGFLAGWEAEAAFAAVLGLLAYLWLMLPSDTEKELSHYHYGLSGATVTCLKATGPVRSCTVSFPRSAGVPAQTVWLTDSLFPERFSVAPGDPQGDRVRTSYDGTTMDLQSAIDCLGHDVQQALSLARHRHL